MEILVQFEKEIQGLSMKPNNHIYSNRLEKKTRKVLEDIETNHNTSWAINLFERNKKCGYLDRPAILYRGNKIISECYHYIYEKKGY